MASIFDFIKNIFVKPTTTTTTNVQPNTASVKVTDFNTGESVVTKTQTSGSTGQSTTTQNAFSQGGGGVSPQRQQQLIQATTDLENSGSSIYVPPTNPNAQAIAEQQKQKKLNAINDVQKTYQDAFDQNGNRFIKEEDTQYGLPTKRVIYRVVPRPNQSPDYVAVSESTPNIKDLQLSQLGNATISDVLNLGDNNKVTFSSTQPLFKTSEGKLATGYGTFDITEDSVIQQEEQARSKQAEQFVSDQKYNPVITPATEDKSIFGKIFNELKVLYTASPFGITSPVETQGNQTRQWVSLGASGGAGGIIIPSFNFASLDLNTARNLVNQQNSDSQIATQQVKAIQDLGILVNKTPADLQYDVQQLGLSKLNNLGINYTVNQNTGELTFTSKELTPKESFAGMELAKSSGFDKFAVGSAIVGIKGLEFYLGSEALNLAVGGAKYGYDVVRGGIGLGEGLRLTEVAVEGGNVVGKAQVVEQTAGKGILSKITKTAVATGVGGLYIAGKVSQYQNYEDVYGKDLGKQLFILETTGELGGIIASVGGGIAENQAIKRVNEGIALRNAQREINLQRIENVKNFGQFTNQARVNFLEVGTGRSVLNTGEKEILQGVFAKELNISLKEAEQLINEGAIFEQNLTVGSPAGFEPFTFSRSGIVTALKGEDMGFKELGIEFNRKGRGVSNIVLKGTVGKGDYAITSVFEKTRKSNILKEILNFGDMKFLKETAGQDQFKLTDVIVSKIAKQRNVKIGETSLSVAEIESRLLKGYATLGKGKARTNLLDTLELGTGAKYSEKDLMNLFERAGVGARTSPKPQNVLRIEEALYRKNGILNVNTEGEFKFLQRGSSGRQLSLKNIMKDLNFKDLENALRTRKPKKTPFSATFGGDATEQNLLKEVEKQMQSQRVKETTGQRTSQMNISPTIASGFKFKIKQTGFEELKNPQGLASRSGGAVKNAIRDLLGLSSVTQQKSMLKEKTISAVRIKSLQQEIQQQQQKQRTQQTPRLRTQPQFKMPNIPFMTDIIGTPRTRIYPERIAYGLGKDNKKMKNILKLKKILSQDELALFPTFTAKALDIPAITVKSESEALRMIKQIKTGFEVTGGVRIRK